MQLEYSVGRMGYVTYDLVEDPLFVFSENRMPLNPLDSHRFPFENIWHHYLGSTYPISETHLASFNHLVFTNYCWGCHMTLFYLLEQQQATIKYTLIISSPMFLSVKSISLSKVGDLISRDPAVPSMLPVVNWYDLNSLKEKYLLSIHHSSVSSPYNIDRG